MQGAALYDSVAKTSATPAMLQKEAFQTYVAQMRRMVSEKRSVELVKAAIKGKQVFAELHENVNDALPEQEQAVLKTIFGLNVVSLAKYIDGDADHELESAIQLMDELLDGW